MGKKSEVVVTLSGIPCKKTVSISSKKVLCHTAPGFGKAAVGVVVREYASKLANLTTANVNTTGVYTFVKLRVTGMDILSATTRGGVNRTIFGEGFPRNGTVGFIGGKKCQKSVVINSMALRCVTPAGTGKNHTVEVRVLNGNLSSVLQGTEVKFNYERPRINKKEIEGPKGGHYYINVTGDNFGPNGSKPVILLDGEACLATKRMSQKMARCLVPPGAGRKKINIDVLGRNATQEGSFLYTPASILRVDNNMGPTKGGFKIVIHGDGFGVSAEDEKAAEDEGKKQMQAELEEELDEEKKKSEAELGKEMGDDAAAMGELAKKIKNETAAEEEDLKEQNATATKLRQQEELTE